LGHIKGLLTYEVLALYGTNGLTKEHERALQSCEELEEVILMLDGDAAGKKASVKYQLLLSELRPAVRVKIVELPKGTDVNELWSNHLSEDLFLELLTNAGQPGPNKASGMEEVEELKPKQREISSPKSKLDTSYKHNFVFSGKYATYYIKGFSPVKHLDSLKITLVTEKEGKKYRGKVELYEDKEIQKYCKAAGLKLEI
jgi:hypothetical protein